MISVVVRARNEGSWMTRCMRALRMQSASAELDLILVDNESTDNTVAIAKDFGARVVTISQERFSFGRALNIGIVEARFEVVALLSSHCVPVNDLWASYLHGHFADDNAGVVCGVYGRQEPLPETSMTDRRDLWTTFRDERVRQVKDHFFHNANSAIRKSIWEMHPFNEQIRGVEDREWGKRMIRLGRQIIYEPNARVNHYHGIHHGQDEVRAKRVAEVIEYIRGI